ncbi:Phytoene dehydrogenase [Geopyxis carbonaria]|nr:Phytoene dehydrogenase [Geopyxis carbonaria]
MTTKRTAIVVGAGVGGVATAARLAKAGFDVTVVEKNNHTGGRCSLLRDSSGAYRFDQGPSLLLLPSLFHETFADLDTTMADEGVELLRCEPNYEMHFADGEKLQLSSDLAVMKREVERFEGKDGFERYLGFLQESHRHYELSVKHVLKKNFGSWYNMLRPSFLRYVVTLHPFSSIWGRASTYFWSDRLRRAFTFSSMYLGMSPFDAPGTYSLLQYTELAEGIWYPRGGFHKVVEAIVNIGERLGVKYRLNTGVSSVLLSADGQTATGVVLESGEVLTADVVVLNCDLAYAYTKLLPESSYSRSLQTRKHSCSSISFYWALNRRLPSLVAHNIFLAAEYKDSFDAIFDRQEMPSEPSFYVNVPSRVDATAAPDGCDAVVVLLPIGHLTPANSAPAAMASLVDRARQLVLATLSARTGDPDIASAIVSETVNTPLTWRTRFNLTHGAILGLSHSFFNVLAFRPTTRHPKIQQCFFVGASTHPGTGVPICLAGAKITSEQIMDSMGVPKPTQWAQKEVKDSEITGVGRAQDFAAVLVVLVGVLGWWAWTGFGAAAVGGAAAAANGSLVGAL